MEDAALNRGGAASAAPPAELDDPVLGPFVRASDVTLSSLIGPPDLMRRAAARKPSAASLGPGFRPAPEPWGGPASPPRQEADPRATAYRLYLIKHCVVMTPLVYVLVIGRRWLAAQVHGDAPESLQGTGSLSLLYRGSWGLLLSAALAFAVWVVRRPDVLRHRAAPSDALLTRLVVFDCVLSALNATSMLEYAGRRERECPKAASMADCLLRVYWPSTHAAFLTKWAGSAYPTQVVFAPELFRSVSFALGALRLVYLHDGAAAALRPRFLLGLAARAGASMGLTMLTLALWLPRTRFAELRDALPPRLLDATCPRPLRRARDACCALVAAAAAAGRAVLRPLPHGAQLAAAAAAARAGDARGGGMPPIGVAALSLLIAILNNDLRLHAIGRMQVGLFWVGIAVQALSTETVDTQSAELWLPGLGGSAESGSSDGSGLSTVSGAAAARAAQPQLSWADVELDDVLGSGSYATVHAARWRGTRVALKCWFDSGGDGDDVAETKVMAEAALLMSLRHPNVLIVYGVLPRPRALVMERGVCTLGEVLSGEEARTNGLRWARRVDLARDVAAGVEFLHAHSPPIIHGDITCSNVLVAADGRCKLSDFGTSFVSALGANAPLSVCSVEYAAPEVLRRQPVRVPQAVDAFSFGVVMARIAAAPHRMAPGGALATQQGSGSVPRFLRSVSVVYAAERAGFQPSLPRGCPEEFASLVRACCAEAPALRPAFGQLRRDLDAAHTRANTWLAPNW